MVRSNVTTSKGDLFLVMGSGTSAYERISPAVQLESQSGWSGLAQASCAVEADRRVDDLRSWFSRQCTQVETEREKETLRGCAKKIEVLVSKGRTEERQICAHHILKTA